MKNDLYLLVLILISISCQKWDFERNDFPVITTGAVSKVEFLSARLEGEIAGLRKGMVTQHGHIWSATAEVPELTNEGIGKTTFGERSNGIFSSTLTGLKMNTRYYYRAYAIIEGESNYGVAKNFTTRNILIAVDTVIGAPNTEVTIVGNIQGPSIAISEELELRLPITDYGFVWSSTSTSPTVEESYILPQGPLSDYGSFEDQINGLTEEFNYYVRAYIIIEDVNVIYSETHPFHSFPSPVGWKRMKDFAGQVRVSAFDFAVGSKVYLGGGESADVWLGVFETSPALDDFWEFDPLNNNWSTAVLFPSDSRMGAASFAINDKGYVGVGAVHSDIPGFLEDVWEFTASAGWERCPVLEDYANDIITPSVFSIHNLAFSLNGKGYFANDTQIWEFDPENKSLPLKRMTDFPDITTNTCFFIPVEEDNMAYCWNSSNNVLWKYDPNDTPKGGWTALGIEIFPEDNVEVGDLINIPTNGKGYFGPGKMQFTDFNTLLPDLWEFNPKAIPGERWKRMPDYPGSYIDQGLGLAIDGKLYIGVGITIDRQPTREFWQFTPPQ